MTCEEWRVAAMALADGEMPPVSRAAIETHLVTCDGCRRVIEELQELASTWDGRRRSDCYVDLWPAIQDRLRRPKRHWLPMLVALLVTFKLADLVTDTSLALWVQVVPVLMAAAAFALLRQNPFRIQTDLALKEAEL